MTEQQPGGSGEGTRSEGEIVTWLIENVADALGEDVSAVDPHRPLTELGLSSRDGVAMAADLEDWLDIELPATMVWEFPTIALLAHHLAGGAPAEVAPAATTTPVASTEPTADDDLVAIVGIGCRLPGGIDGPEAFWNLLETGSEGISEVPAGRWEDFGEADPAAARVLERTTRWGGFLSDVKGFDAEFFGITPREAELMDPQQRMLLEVAHEALEHAGIPADSLRGTATGVYVGISGNEYSALSATDLTRIEAWTATGVALSIAANRMSYLLDLRGPSLALDTACSSSLVAVHQACQSIRSGETDQAIVAGVNLTLAPPVTVNFDLGGLLAEDGRCKTFSAQAGGIVRSEGAGVAVLKRLSDARRDGDPILAVVRGSAVNQDGRSNGMMAPNPQAQEAVLAQAYRAAGIEPGTVDYVEAHGTGTLLGDPIEARALAAVVGAGREDAKPLLIGSVKTNLGHLEAAAGITGLIKVVLSMQHDTIPASLHAQELNPHIPWDRNHLQVTREATSWPRYSGVARAGVSGFGFGGTNAHVVLEEFTEAAPHSDAVDDGAARLLVVSGLNEDRMRKAARALGDWLATPAGAATPLADVVATAGRRRELGGYRGVVTARTREDLVSGLARLADGVEGPQVLSGRSERRGPGARKGPVWVFSGFGSQWAGMGKQLLADEPVFAATVDELEPLLQAEANLSLRGILADGAKPGSIAETQIVIFGVQVALAALWRSYGVEPAAIVGHSMGEVAAAVVSGSISLADGAKVISQRSLLLDTVSNADAGSMAVVDLSSEELDALTGRFPGLGVAVHAAPQQCTVSGDTEQLHELVEEIEDMGRNAWVLKVKGAAHSAVVEPIMEPLRTAVRDVRGATPSVPIYSTVREDNGVPSFDADYWVSNVRQPVRFWQAIAAAAADGYDTFVEISPHPVVVMSIRATLEKTPPAGSAGRPALVLGTLRRDADDTLSFLAAVGTVLSAGHAVDPKALWPGVGLAALPRTLWQHEDFWIKPRRVASGLPKGAHSLLGIGGELPEGDRYVWRSDVGLENHPWLADHAVQGVAVLSGTTYAEMALAAGMEVFGVPVHDVVLQELELDEILVLTDHTTVMTSVKLTGPLTGTVEIFAKRGTGTGGWVRHANAVLVAEPAPAEEPFEVDLSALERGGHAVDVYDLFGQLGHSYGPAFTGLSDAYAGEGGVSTARVTLPAEAPADPSFLAHPALLDICLQSLAAAASSSTYAGKFDAALYLPLATRRLLVRRPGVRQGHVYAKLAPIDETGQGLLGQVRLVGDDGELILEARDVFLRRLDVNDVPKPLGEKLFTSGWEPTPLPVADSAATRRFLLLAPVEPAAGAPVVSAADLAAALTEAGDVAIDGGSVSVTTPADVTAALAAAAADGPLDGVVLLTPDRDDLPVGPTADDEGVTPGERGVLAAIATAQALVEGTPARLWMITRGASVLGAGEPGQPAAAALRGVVRTVAFEHGELRASVVDLDPAAAGLGDLVAELQASGMDDEIAWRGGVRFAARMRRAEVPAVSGGAVVRPGAYVVSGSLSGSGFEFARWLAERGARRIVLNARRPADEAAQAVAEMQERGTEVVVILGDIAEPGTAEAMVEAAIEGGVRLCGVAHAANQLVDSLLGDIDAEKLSLGWKAKVRGAWRLHEVTVGRDIDWWLGFSSVAALMGSPAQTTYSAANAWLDGLVAWRRALGMPGTTVNWGPWGAPKCGQVDWPFLEPLGISEGMEALDTILGADLDRIGVARFNAANAVDIVPEFRTAPFFAPLLAEVNAAGDELSDDDWIGVEGLRGLEANAARAVLSERIVARMASIMGYHSHQVDRYTPLTQLGFDSLMAVRARNAVQADLGLPMPVRLLLQGATLADLEQHLADELGLGGSAIDLTDRPRIIVARDPSERFVALAWSEALGRTDLSVDADFASFGERADDAARAIVAAKVSDRLGDAWTQERIFAETTIEGQANLVRDELEGNAGRPVRPLRAKGSQPPLFLFHPAGGPTSVYEPMVGQMDPDQPVYGLERIEELPTVEEKATRYIELIREIQPHGPYRLGGWSLGGTLAYETAMQLEALGEQIDVVAMLDTVLPIEVDDETEAELLIERLGRFLEQMQETYGVTVDFDLNSLRGLTETEQIDALKQLLETSGVEMSPGVIEHQRTSYIDGRVSERYKPRTWDGRVVLYKAKEHNAELVVADTRYSGQDANGWDVFAEQLEIHLVPGDHISLIDRPHVDTIAEHLGALLAELALQNA